MKFWLNLQKRVSIFLCVQLTQVGLFVLLLFLGNFNPLLIPFEIFASIIEGFKSIIILLPDTIPVLTVSCSNLDEGKGKLTSLPTSDGLI